MTKRGSLILIRDALAGLALFGGGLAWVAGFDGWSIARATAADLPVGKLGATLALVHDADGAGLAGMLHAQDVAGQIARIAVLGLTFATMFACNMALVRHLRRVYASPRRNGWRRGRRPGLTGS